MHPLDILEHKLAMTGSPEVGPLQAAANGSLADAIEFAAVRWSWWSTHRADLLACVNQLGAGRFPPLGLRSSLLFRNGQFDDGEVMEVPPDSGTNWAPGGAFVEFQERFKNQLVRSGLTSRFAHHLVGVLNEMASNAIEHARSPLPPICSYETHEGTWTFSVTDVGCGILGSLRRNARYAALRDHVESLRLAVEDGVSSTGLPTRGHGFTGVFKVLVNRMCSIRFRTTQAVATWEGTAPAAHTLQLMPMPNRAGFHVRISGATK